MNSASSQSYLGDIVPSRQPASASCSFVENRPPHQQGGFPSSSTAAPSGGAVSHSFSHLRATAAKIKHSNSKARTRARLLAISGAALLFFMCPIDQGTTRGLRDSYGLLYMSRTTDMLESRRAKTSKAAADSTDEAPDGIEAEHSTQEDGIYNSVSNLFASDGSKWSLFILAAFPATFVLKFLLGENLAPKKASWTLVGGIFASVIFFVIMVSRVLPQGELSTALWSGLFSGAFHALAGPDHLACLTPLTLGRASTTAAFLGSLWGLGHGLSALILCMVCVSLKSWVVTIQAVLQPISTAVVGATLMIIGIVGLREQNEEAEEEEALQNDIENENDGEAREEDVAAGQKPENKQDTKAAPSPKNVPPLRRETSKARIAGVLMTGVFYGFTPDSLLLVAPGLGLGSQAATIVFFLSNIIGTALSMGLYAFTLAQIGERFPALARGVGIASSVCALLFGFSFLLSTAVGTEQSTVPSPLPF